MKRRQFAVTGISSVALASLTQLGIGQDRRTGQNAANQAKSSGQGHLGQSEAYRHCAKACSDCQRECDTCALHCAEMLGHDHGQNHQTTLRTCLDCADVCGAAAQIVSRGGPFAGAICEACADVCRRCADACKQHPDGKIMQACAEECQRCEKACRDMVRTARQDTGRKPG